MFEQEVEDIEDWITDMKKQLASQDMGRDLISINNLIKAHSVRNHYKCKIMRELRACGLDVGE